MILGATTLYWFAALLTKWNGFVEDDPIESGRLYTVFTIWLLPEVFALTFRRPWGLWPAAVFVAGGGAVGLAGYLIGGGVWNPVLAAWTYAGDLLVWGALAVSFPVAILARSPGASSALSPGCWLAARVRPRRGRPVPWAWTASMHGRPHGEGERPDDAELVVAAAKQGLVRSTDWVAATVEIVVVVSDAVALPCG